MKYVKCHQPWQREFLLRSKKYQLCQVLAAEICEDDDGFGSVRTFMLARTPEGREFFAVPNFGTWVEADDAKLECAMAYAQNYRNSYMAIIMRERRDRGG